MLDILIIILIALVLAVLLPLFTTPTLVFAMIKTKQTQYPLSFKQLFGMYLRKQNLKKMVEVNNIIQLNNLELSLNDVEHIYLLGGNVDQLLDEALKCKQNYKEFIFSNYLKANF